MRKYRSAAKRFHRRFSFKVTIPKPKLVWLPSTSIAGTMSLHALLGDNPFARQPAANRVIELDFIGEQWSFKF